MHYQPAPYLLCQQVQDGIKVLRAFGDYPRISLPDTIDGKPVTEIGPYCFSASDKALSEGDFLWNTSTSSREPSPLPQDQALCGSFLEGILISSGLRTLHNGAFYNCRNLKRLSFGPDVRSVGSDVFTNCRQLKGLEIRGDDKSPTGLSLLLERLPDNLTVHFPGRSLLFFPEYYEWMDEVTPAHLFSRTIHGEGYRMRRCFQDRVLDYSKYDQCFPAALATETDENLCRIALLRLLYPISLGQGPKDLYRSAAEERGNLCLTIAIKDRDTNLLRFLCDELALPAGFLREAQEKASRKDWGEGSALLMEAVHKKYEKPTFEFDLDF